MDLKGKKVVIVGAARSGIAAANLALAMGAVVKITDAKSLTDLEAALSGLKERTQVLVEHGAHTSAFVEDADLVVASPGVWKDALPLQWARAKGIPVWGEIEFAWRFCRKPVIAVTGSNGKTTTVTLIRKVLEAAGRKACLCGNVGVPFAQEVLAPEVDFFVVEISSFQLELIETFRPTIAVITNFSQNHLDRHPDMQDYFNAKKRLFMNQTEADFAVINAQDAWAQKIEAHTRAKVVRFNKNGLAKNPNHALVLEIARILGITDAVAQKVFDTFPGVEHRTERVRVLDGVEYINDSKATTVESGRWALTACEGPLIIICGGHDKGEIDLSVLKSLVRSKVKKMIVLTREELVRAKLHAAFDGVVPLEDHTDMTAAVASARAQAVAGDKVLLSPMFASFDMFNNFEHRGKIFKEIVNSLTG
ncbi:MAG: UDP-N-acetylmuramoyl-L-alanine--D-glutamate ligase [Candidatus Omnitrophica bacterium]|nr:UDP-N-acetylmuramoyl-L-alanine--D-glutamate ligase [Candidatus Omnitrophota bacterium]